LHGDMDQSERNKVITSFKRQETNILVATDVAGKIYRDFTRSWFCLANTTQLYDLPTPALLDQNYAYKSSVHANQR